jgi:hypothetical protein
VLLLLDRRLKWGIVRIAVRILTVVAIMMTVNISVPGAA